MHLVQASLRLIQFDPQFWYFYFFPILLRYSWHTALYIFFVILSSISFQKYLYYHAFILTMLTLLYLFLTLFKKEQAFKTSLSHLLLFIIYYFYLYIYCFLHFSCLLCSSFHTFEVNNFFGIKHFSVCVLLRLYIFL